MRRRFILYWELHHEPRLILVASEIGISKNYLVNWKNNKVDLSVESLKKIDKFLKKHDV
ncbi:hypothetical protein BUY79_12620 [Staphylococcus equorum]|uniref:helix-turn-helix domain-containing protein n=1 Tax=Staphylococcus equorum TaxID=246432 RepID=UPI000D1CF449|nr:helix-turn-helix transcriptional regulator [Staphylococcus equorum]PTE82525.1 hypothetical protein BUY79_12620 [Staphylococcus equorum]